ncbi:SsrA-binding protein SmpB [Nitrospina gracilis]|uniref:SsrA-binding protein SmpB n=1 Tax=Nitrospina gracilis TaxID=35801 RepID=UPI001F36D5D7|nr:SsrA-binding protein SmpB [Nitrospina gracilis]MCF8720165.1 SsrA-binding protein [Nitrospina gracilis Nb-211]
MSDIKIVCQNKKARHDYFIEDTMEAGIALMGTEVKSLRDGRANLVDSYAWVERNEVYLHHCHISPYTPATQFNHDPMRKRKLLLHRKEINRLIGASNEKGYSLIPLKIYFKNGIAKVELAIAKGKKQHDKRESIKKRESDREIRKAMKGDFKS